MLSVPLHVSSSDAPEHTDTSLRCNFLGVPLTKGLLIPLGILVPTDILIPLGVLIHLGVLITKMFWHLCLF